MASHVIDFRIFGDQFSTAEIRAIFEERAMIQRWLDVEAALALAQAELGIVPSAAAAVIADCARVDLLDLDAIAHNLAGTAHPIVPVVRELGRVAGEAGHWVHWGATTQDIMDTGLVLQMKATHFILKRDLATLVRVLSGLAREHRDCVMVGRTHGQQALPITFGFKVAIWIAECLRHLRRLDEIAPRLLVGELAGGVGTLASFGPRGAEVQAIMLERLGLGVPLIAWHASRDSVTEFVSLLALIGGTLARISNEVIHLQRSEIMELEEPFAHGKVGSSTMPHKRNPVHAERIVAIGRMLRGLAATAFETMVAAHERDQSVTRAEWALVPEACCLAAGSLHWSLAIARGLHVNAGRMAANLDTLEGLLLSEPVMLEIGATIGRNAAHDLVYEAAMGSFEGRGAFRDLLLQDVRLKGRISSEKLDALLRPETYTGLAGHYVDRVLEEAAAVLTRHEDRKAE